MSHEAVDFFLWHEAPLRSPIKIKTPCLFQEPETRVGRPLRGEGPSRRSRIYGGSTRYKRRHYLLAKLNGQGCGMANSMSSAPTSAMFFRKLIMSACFICGSDTAQKLCMR